LKIDFKLKESLNEELIDLIKEAMVANVYDNPMIQSGLSYFDTICSTRFDLIKRHERRYIDKIMKLVVGKLDANIKFEDLNKDFLIDDLPKRVRDRDFEKEIVMRAYNFLGYFCRNFQNVKGTTGKYANKVAELVIKITFELFPEVELGFSEQAK
jgi:hypothetical protein